MPYEVKERKVGAMKRDAQLALQRKAAVRGVKGPTRLSNLPGFNIVWGLYTEYMHSILLRVVQQITNL